MGMGNAAASTDTPAVALSLADGEWSVQVLDRVVADAFDNRALVKHLVLQPVRGGVPHPITGTRQPTAPVWHPIDSDAARQLVAQYPQLAQLTGGV